MKNFAITPVFFLFLHLANAQNLPKKDSSFSLAQTKFLEGMEQKNLTEMMTAVDDSVTMIFPDGDIMQGKKRFYEFNQAWFKKDWKISTELVKTDLKSDMAYSLVRYRYLKYKSDKSEGSLSYIYLLLIFKKRESQWLLVYNQHTKVLL